MSIFPVPIPLACYPAHALTRDAYLVPAPTLVDRRQVARLVGSAALWGEDPTRDPCADYEWCTTAEAEPGQQVGSCGNQVHNSELADAAWSRPALPPSLLQALRCTASAPLLAALLPDPRAVQGTGSRPAPRAAQSTGGGPRRPPCLPQAPTPCSRSGAVLGPGQTGQGGLE